MTRPATIARRTKKSAEAITSIKGFNRDLTCQGFQFEVGKTYQHDGKVEVCKSGFHACTTDAHPFSVFCHYAPGASRYHEVVQHGPFSTDDDVKICSAKITIGVELSISELTKRAVEWVFKRAKKEEGSSATGYWGAASATGNWGAASATGYHGAASATGNWGAASATGNWGAASATGYQGAASATGNWGAASATGEQGAASATGNWGAASATGYWGAASATGKASTAMACGYDGRVSAATGCALFAVERDAQWNIISVACGIVGKKGIKPDTLYRCAGGKLVEAAR